MAYPYDDNPSGFSDNTAATQPMVPPQFAYSYGGNGVWNRTPGYTGSLYTGDPHGFDTYLQGGGASPDDWTKFQADAKAKGFPQAGPADVGTQWIGFASSFTGNPNTSRGGSQGGFIPGGNAYRGNLQSVVDAYNAKYGTQAKVAGADKIDFGDGRGPQDVITSGGDFWYGGPMPGSAPAGSGGSGGAPPPAAGTSGTGVQTGALDPKVQGLYDQLLKRATQGTTIDPNDPTIRAQTDTFSANQERTRRNYLAQLAESLGPNANLTPETRLTAEQTGQATAGFEAQLMAKELQNKRDEIAAALSSMQGLLTGQQQMSLTKELALIDDALKRTQLAQQGSEFQQELGYQYDLPQLQYQYGSAF